MWDETTQEPRYYTDRDALMALATALDDLVNVHKSESLPSGLAYSTRQSREAAVERAREALAYLQAPAEEPLEQPERAAEPVGSIRYDRDARSLVLSKFNDWGASAVSLVAMSDGTVRWER